MASWLGSTVVQALRQSGDAAADTGQSSSPAGHAQLAMETLLALANAAGSAAPSEQLGVFVQELQVVLQQAKGVAAGRQSASLLLPLGGLLPCCRLPWWQRLSQRSCCRHSDSVITAWAHNTAGGPHGETVPELSVRSVSLGLSEVPQRVVSCIILQSCEVTVTH